MAKVDVLDWNKKTVGSVELEDKVFGADVRKDIMHTLVRWQLAKRRQGTHKSKTKAEVSGGGKKPFKQKGTGNARQGSSRSPLNESGGSIFGPKPRDYSYSVPRKIRQAGLRSALSFLNKEGRLFVIDKIDSSEGKTKELNDRLGKFGASKAVLIDTEANQLMKRASRNLQTVKYYSPDGLNVYDLLKFNTAIISKDSLTKINQRCGLE